MESDGTLSASTASYETLVTADNDVPNKKYVDDGLTAGIAAIAYPYDLHAFLVGLPSVGAGTIVYRWTVPRPITLTGGAHFAYCDATTTATTTSGTFDVAIATPGGSAPGASLGTIVFGVGSTTGVVAALGPVALAAGDELVITYTTLDGGPTLDNVVIGLLATAP